MDRHALHDNLGAKGREGQGSLPALEDTKHRPPKLGYKTLYEFATPDGLLWYEIAKAESYERVTKVVSRYYPMVDKVTVQPLLRAEDFLAQF